MAKITKEWHKYGPMSVKGENGEPNTIIKFHSASFNWHNRVTLNVETQEIRRSERAKCESCKK